MKLTMLTENSVYCQSLRAEHGLSMFIECNGITVLYDTGASGLFFKNAKVLGLDLKNCSYVVLSHGHYDHGGGLQEFLKLNDSAKLLAHPHAFNKKYGMYDGELKDISMPALPESLYSGRVIPIESECMKIAEGFYILHAGGARQKKYFSAPDILDTFNDEIFAVFETEQGIVVVSGCSHSTIAAILKKVAEHFNTDSIYAVIGGYHVQNADKEKMQKTIDAFNKYHVQRIGLSHCTGPNGAFALKQACGEKAFDFHTGMHTIL